MKLAERRRGRRAAAVGVSVLVLIVALGALTARFTRDQTPNQASVPTQTPKSSPSGAAVRTDSPYRVNVVWTALVPIIKPGENNEPVIVGWQARDYAIPINPDSLEDNQRYVIHQVLHQRESAPQYEL